VKPLVMPLSRQQEQPSAQLTLEVYVVDAISGAPISDATVDIVEGPNSLANNFDLYELGVDAYRGSTTPPQNISLPPISTKVGLAYGPRKFRSLDTDKLGRSVFYNIPDGYYRLVAAAKGYIREEYGAAAVGKSGRVLNVPHEAKTAVLRLTPAAEIEGNVTSVDELPVPNFSVYLLRPIFTSDGLRDFVAIRKTTTDPTGRFIFTGIAPGRYSVATGRDPEVKQRKGPVQQLAYKWSYYPQKSNSLTAGYIDLGPSGQFRGVKLLLEPQELRSVRGQILDSQPVTSGGGIKVALISSAPFQMLGIEGKRIRSSETVAGDGSFEFHDLEEGSYILEATRPASPTDQARSARTFEGADASFPIEVSGSDIDTMSLRFLDASPIQGKLRTSDNKALSAAVVQASPVSSFGAVKPQLQFQSVKTLLPSALVFPDMTNGSFSMKAISGKYRVEMPGCNVYIKEILLDGSRFQGDTVTISSKTSNIEVILGTDGGSISGVVVDELSKPVQTAIWGLLLPDPLTTTIGFFRLFTLSGNGRFSMETIPPGRYKVFAWSDIDKFSCFDPDVLSRSVVQASSVQVVANSASVINVKAILLR